MQPETLISSYTFQHLLIEQVLSSMMRVRSNALLMEMVKWYRSLTNRCGVLCSGLLFLLIVKSVLSVKLSWSFPCISPCSPSLQTRTDSIPSSYTPFPLTFPVCFSWVQARVMKPLSAQASMTKTEQDYLWHGQGNRGTRVFVQWHGRAAVHCGAGVDACSNELPHSSRYDQSVVSLSLLLSLMGRNSCVKEQLTLTSAIISLVWMLKCAESRSTLMTTAPCQHGLDVAFIAEITGSIILMHYTHDCAKCWKRTWVFILIDFIWCYIGWKNSTSLLFHSRNDFDTSLEIGK